LRAMMKQVRADFDPQAKTDEKRKLG